MKLHELAFHKRETLLVVMKLEKKERASPPQDSTADSKKITGYQGVSAACGAKASRGRSGWRARPRGAGTLSHRGGLAAAIFGLGIGF